MHAMRDNVQQLEDLLDGEDRLVALHSGDVQATLIEFRLLCRRTGRSIYHWSETQGIVSLKAADITVPGCRKLVDAMRYVMQSMHYGVYLFTRFEKQLRPPVVDLMFEIAAMPDHRTVILVGERLELPRRLAGRLRHVMLSEPAHGGARPRLRDGRWVI